MKSRYRREDGAYLIEIKLSSARQMFNSLDPAPFIEKDLDDDAEAYIVDSVREFHLNIPLRLVIHLPKEAVADASKSLPDAIRNYFAYRADITRKELRHTLRQGRASLMIGLAFLFLCIGLRGVVDWTSYGTLSRIIEEGLLISGWVAMWRPMQIFLYDWWPIRNKQRLLAKIHGMPIDIRESV